MSMITEQQLISFMKEKAYKPMNIHELSQALPVDSSDELTELVLLLNRMEDNGLVVRTRTHCYGLPEKMNLVVGTVQGKSKGFAFVIPDSRTEPDVYISAGDLAGALHGDRVIARVHKKNAGPKLEGAIIRILKRAATTVVGTLSATEHYAMVRPDDPRLSIELFIPREQLGGALNGQKVVAEITRYPEEYLAPEGRIIEVLGNPDAPGVDILSVIRKYGLPEQFPDPVLEEADRVSDTIRAEELQGRRDLRGVRMVTIDSEHAKDLDDAVSVERLANGNILLGVHIADVSYYVKEGSHIDQEALNRGTSVYLVDRVIPMLPHRLSNGICSLNPQVDRLTLTCEMEWHPSGERVRHEIYSSVIRTTERMTYENVKRILIEQTPDLMQRYADLVDDFVLMEELAMKLRARRMRRGAIDFEFPETRVLVDAEGKPTDIVKRERSIAEQIIEEFMLAANETVAEEFHRLGIPFLYRVHEQPDAERIRSLGEFVHNFGYSARSLIRTAGKGADADSSSVSPKALQELLEQVKGNPEERIISTVTLRSMKQARYAADPLGHFGLAAEFYSHFTSPIRRYPDLQIHRIIREVIAGGGVMSEARLERYRELLGHVATRSSERERNAVDAERETDQLKKVEYMEDKIGEEFEGIVSGVAQYGLFVELDNSIEGLIHVSYLADDYYHYNEKAYSLVGERTGRTFRIGDPVKIRVAGVNKEERQIDFMLLEGGFQRGEYVERDASNASGRAARVEAKTRYGDWKPTPAQPAKKQARGSTRKPGAAAALPARKGKAKDRYAGQKNRVAKSTKTAVAEHVVDEALPVFGKVKTKSARMSRTADPARGKSRPTSAKSGRGAGGKVSRAGKSRRPELPADAHPDVYQPKRSPVGSSAGPTEPFYDVFVKKKR